MNVTWLLNGKAIDSFHDISLARLGKRVNALTIDSVAAHHAGNYSCRAQNKAGVTEHYANLVVNGLFIINLFFKFYILLIFFWVFIPD